MRRVPSDSELGAPIAALKNRFVALFENGTLGYYHIENQTDGMENNTYRFYYNHVSELSHLKLTDVEELPRYAKIFSQLNTQLFVTFIVSVILLLTYIYSIRPSELPLIETFPKFVKTILGWSFVIGIVFFEMIVVELASQSVKKSRILQIHLVHRTEPYTIIEDDKAFSFQLLQFHNLFTRMILVAAILDIGDKTTFYEDIMAIVIVVAGLNAMLYLLALPLFLFFYVVKGMYKFPKVPNLKMTDFYHELMEKTRDAKSKINSEKNETLTELLSGDETSKLEFKGSVWTTYNRRSYEKIESQNSKDLELQDAVVKSVAAFLNTDGGTLLIGVKDRPHLQDEPIVGIENDFKWTKTKDLEGFRHALIQLLDDAFQDPSISKIYLQITYPKIYSKLICRIDVNPLPRVPNGELWVKTKTLGNEEFFYRASDTSTHASAKSASRYIRHHFEGYSNLED